MIDVEALIRQIVPKAILAHGINGAVLARRSDPFPWFDEIEKQHGSERDNERGADQRRGSCVEGIREGIFEDV